MSLPIKNVNDHYRDFVLYYVILGTKLVHYHYYLNDYKIIIIYLLTLRVITLPFSVLICFCFCCCWWWWWWQYCVYIVGIVVVDDDVAVIVIDDVRCHCSSKIRVLHNIFPQDDKKYRMVRSRVHVCIRLTQPVKPLSALN